MAMTLLESVNTMLAMIGEAPVETLATEGANTITDAALAYQTLQEVDRDVQSEGWSWNTDIDYTLTKDGSNQFLLPSSTLRAEFDSYRYPDREYVTRGLKVYDRKDHTSTFPTTETLVVSRLVRQLTWDELPYHAQQYILIRAGRIFGARFVNAAAVYGYSVNDEQYARAQLMRDEQEKDQSNLIWGDGPVGLGYEARRGRRYRVN